MATSLKNPNITGDDCPTCNHTGTTLFEGIIEQNCPECQGTGVINSPEACPDCKGSGSTVVSQIEIDCPTCEGSGTRINNQTVSDEIIIDSHFVENDPKLLG